MSTPQQISFSDLADAGVRLRSSEAATIARDISLRAATGELPGIPSPTVIRLTSTGDIVVEGPVGADREVERAARLLQGLLPGFDAPRELRVPGALRLVMARALGLLDLPPYGSLAEFADALGRFSAPDTAACVIDIFTAWSTAVTAPPEAQPIGSPAWSDADTGTPAEITISDVRRARRATRLTLADISERTCIPVSLLRELEWGYLEHWPSGFHARTQIVRYARAAGLDERVVVDAVRPLLESRSTALEAIPSRQLSAPVVTDAIVVEDVEELPAGLVPIAPGALVSNRPRYSRRARLAAALAIPALVVIGLVPVYWNSRAAKPEAVSVVRQEPARTPPASPALGRATGASTGTPPPAAPASRPAALRPEPRPARFAPSAVTATGFSPAFASAGSAMFYHADARSGSAILRADTDATGAVLRVTSVVDDHAHNFHARPSPDGSRIAFDSDRDGERGVYIADVNGHNVRRVTGGGFAAVPSWSPDGSQLAFVRAEPDAPRVWNIWMVDLATGNARRITSHRYGQPWGAAWFPDGRRIAYSHETRLIVRALDGSSERVFNSPIAGRLIRTPAVSPDGRRIMFQVYHNGAWLLDLRDGSMRRILADPSAEEFTWAPDGRRVAYHSRRNGSWGVWVMAAQ